MIIDYIKYCFMCKWITAALEKCMAIQENVFFNKLAYYA